MNWQPIETAPLNVEVLAFHERGQNWHQVKWNGTHWVMRWEPSFRQFFLDYTHWMPLPPPPTEQTSDSNRPHPKSGAGRSAKRE